MIAFVDERIGTGKRHEGKFLSICNLISGWVVVDYGYIGILRFFKFIELRTYELCSLLHMCYTLINILKVINHSG